MEPLPSNFTLNNFDGYLCNHHTYPFQKGITHMHKTRSKLWQFVKSMQVNYLHQVHSGEITIFILSITQTSQHSYSSKSLKLFWFLWHTKLLDASTTLQKGHGHHWWCVHKWFCRHTKRHFCYMRRKIILGVQVC
jgi:hypothetical protein